MSYTPEGKNAEAVKLAGRVMDILTVPKGLWVFDSSVLAAATQIDYSNNANTATSVALAATEKEFKGNCPYVNFPSNNATKYFSVDDSATLTFGNGGADSAFSIIALVNVTLNAAIKIIIGKWNATATTMEWSFHLAADETAVLELEDQSVPINVTRTSDAAVSAGWHLLVSTYDATGGANAMNGALIYVDGALVASTAGNQGNYVAMEDLAAPVLIGALLDNAAVVTPLNGGLGLVGVTGEELTAAQVWQLWIEVKAYYQL